MGRIEAALRRLVKHPKYLTVVDVVDGVKWCRRCNVSGRGFLHHKPNCLLSYTKRPITWGPPAEWKYVEARSAADRRTASDGAGRGDDGSVVAAAMDEDKNRT